MNFNIKMVLHGESSSDEGRLTQLAVHRSTDTYCHNWTNGFVAIVIVIIDYPHIRNIARVNVQRVAYMLHG
jgi:hypothetical protein